jgi:hypothetical protein
MMAWMVATLLATIPPLLGLSASAAFASQSYVALGDSYTAGPLIPDQLPNPAGCLRSDRNYPHVAASALGLALTDVSCSGATTIDMTSAQSVTFGSNPPQLGAVTPSTSVVSIGIGGNDINFAGIIQNCAAASPWGPTKVGWTCYGHYVSNGVDQIAAAINATGPKVSAVLQRIHLLAPNAKVFVVGYPAILPPTGSGCWPQMPLVNSDVGYLRAKQLSLNSMLKTVSLANKSVYIDTYGPSVSHSACASESKRWVEPIVPSAWAAPVHPNATGEAAMATILEGALRS